MKYELVEKSDDIVFCHRLFQEVFAYQHALTETQTMGLNCTQLSGKAKPGPPPSLLCYTTCTSNL